MSIFVSLLRGINVGGHKKIKMADLRALYESLGLAGAQSLLQTGNVVFASDADDPAQLKQRIEAAIETQYDFHSEVIMRTADDFRELADLNPFLEQESFDPKKLLVFFLEDAPTVEAFGDLMQAHVGPETIHIDGQEAFVYYPDGMGRSKLSNVLIERKLRVVGTGRNWNTVLKIVALVEEFEID